MEYLLVIWRTATPHQPKCMYSELDDERRETRKVYLFDDGAMMFASEDVVHGRMTLPGGLVIQIGLSEWAIKPPTEIKKDPAFEARPITKLEFEDLWQRAGGR